jgi:predicted ATPase/DNA-binding winged helix-turn-helix (wHTH) protein/Tfp pilus assembly protein PilF
MRCNMEPGPACLPAVLGFGRFEVRAASRQLLVDGQPVFLGARAFDVLIALIERRGRLVSKDELLDLAWPGLVVEENNLQVQISGLRKIFGAAAIATVPGRGYQFTLELTHQAEARPKRSTAPTHNLPSRVTSFVGREAELEEVRAALSGSRLVTLIGAGGVGKTRLAIESAARAIDDFSDGVWLVELAPHADSRIVHHVVANLLGVREEPGEERLATLIKALHHKSLLLVLDNCEHVVEACAWLCDRLLAGCPSIQILATSREPLRAPGETTFRVPSLELPGLEATITAEALACYPAVRLFMDRAASVQLSFRIDECNGSAIAGICRRLDGIPLAIELAAARIRSMSVHDVHSRLDERFRLLTVGARTALPRQQTLRAVIDWSYDLLSAQERALLCRLSVFAGGATLDAVQSVCSGDGVEAVAVLDMLSLLVDKSLVFVEERATPTRYFLLETVQHYARDRLRETDDGAASRMRHLAFFAAFAEDAKPHLRGNDQQTWFDRLQVELDNLRVALMCATSPGAEGKRGLRLAAAIWWFWYVRGYFTEGRRWLAAVIAGMPTETTDRILAEALYGEGVLAYGQSDYVSSCELLERSLAISRSLGDLKGVADALNVLGVIAKEQSQYDRARILQEESLSIQRTLGNRAGVAIALCNVATIADDVGQYSVARAEYAESLELFRELGDEVHIALLLQNLGNVAEKQGDYAPAEELHTQSLALRRKLGDRRGVSMALENLGATIAALGDHARARPLLEESLEIRRALGDRRGVALSLAQLGRVLLEQGDVARARAVQRESLLTSWELGDRLGIAAALEGLAAALDDLGSAARLWGCAEELRREIDAPIPPSIRSRHDLHVARARAASGDGGAFDAAWKHGKGLPIDAIIEDALAPDA